MPSTQPQSVSQTPVVPPPKVSPADAPVLKLIHHGLKRWYIKDSTDRVVPDADLYIDCRGMKEHGLDRNNPPVYQKQLAECCKDTLDAMEELIINSLSVLKDRRANGVMKTKAGAVKVVPTDDAVSKQGEPYTVCFMCAWGCNRSPNTKAILAGRLAKKGYQVSVPAMQIDMAE